MASKVSFKIEKDINSNNEVEIQTDENISNNQQSFTFQFHNTSQINSICYEKDYINNYSGTQILKMDKYENQIIEHFKNIDTKILDDENHSNVNENKEVITESRGDLITMDLVKTMMNDELKDLNKKYEDNFRDLKLNNLLNLKELESKYDELVNEKTNMIKEINELKKEKKF